MYGVLSFVFYETNSINYYLNNVDDTYDPVLTYEIEIGLELTSSYLDFMVEQSNEVFQNVIKYLRKNIIILLICLFILQSLIYIILIEILIVRDLTQNFFFFRKIYNNLVPDFIVTKEKIIKAKLEV